MDFSSRIERLARSLGDIDVHTEPHYRIAYGYDATAVSGRCGGVAFPTCLEELRRILESSSKLGIPVFARGAGSGFSGGAVPLGGGLAVSTEKLTRVLRLDVEAYEVEVECGIVNKDLQDFLEKHSLFYPPDPASFRFSTIGGNIAENAGGPRAFKYGVTRRYVRSLTWLTCRGEIFTGVHGGPGSLLTGSEGTLGVIYSARLSLLPKPEAFRTLLLEAGEGVDAMEIAGELISEGFCPSVLEYIDAKTMACVNEFKMLRGLNRDVSCLFIEIDGTLSEVLAQYSLLDDFCRKRGLDKIVAWNDAEREAIWELRRLAGWLRGEGAPLLGVYGISLGGYTAALFASIESRLSCAIAMIPVVSLAGLIQRDLSEEKRLAGEALGVTPAVLEQAWAPHAPLCHTPKVAKAGRLIVAGLADRICPPDQAQALFEHWERPAIHWFVLRAAWFTVDLPSGQPRPYFLPLCRWQYQAFLLRTPRPPLHQHLMPISWNSLENWPYSPSSSSSSQWK